MRNCVVYIDDEPAICDLFAMTFEHDGVEILTFTDPEKALAFILANDVALVICDYRMPRMSGLSLLARLGRETPFYLISGEFLRTDKHTAVTGVKGILAKPFDIEAIVEIIASHCDARFVQAPV